jgi:hypothetical protein
MRTIHIRLVELGPEAEGPGDDPDLEGVDGDSLGGRDKSLTYTMVGDTQDISRNPRLLTHLSLQLQVI